MNLCLICKYAKWNVTKSGRLHPNGIGQCTYPITITIPKAFYFVGGDPSPSGGFISRNQTRPASIISSCPAYECEPKFLEMKTFKVWFNNETAVLVDAQNTNEARQKALTIARQNGDTKARVSRVEVPGLR